MIAVFTLLLLTPIACFAFHGTATRLPFCRLPAQKLAFLSGLFASVIITLVAVLVAPGSIFYVGLSSLLIAHVYFHIFNMSETARRIRILVRLVTGSGAAEESYSAERIVNNRIQRLLELRTIQEKEGVFTVRKGPLLGAALLLRGYGRLLFPRRGQG